MVLECSVQYHFYYRVCYYGYFAVLNCFTVHDIENVLRRKGNNGNLKDFKGWVDIQGYRSVHIGKRILRGNALLKRNPALNPLNCTVIYSIFNTAQPTLYSNWLQLHICPVTVLLVVL